MPVVYAPNSVLTSMIWTGPNFASGNGATVLGWNVADLVGTEGASDVANNMIGAWTTELRSIFDDNITLSEVRWETANASGSVSSGLAGQSSAPTAPSNSALLVSYYAAGKGRRNRGRSYWPGFLSENLVNERGTLDNTFITSLATALAAFFSQVEGGPGTPIQAIPQSSHPEQKSPPQSPWPEVVTRVVRPVVGTQRRRVRP